MHVLINDNEIATVLAALRLLQKQSPEALREMEHFNDGETALTDEQIDELCERINGDWKNNNTDRYRELAREKYGEEGPPLMTFSMKTAMIRRYYTVF